MIDFLLVTRNYHDNTSVGFGPDPFLVVELSKSVLGRVTIGDVCLLRGISSRVELCLCLSSSHTSRRCGSLLLCSVVNDIAQKLHNNDHWIESG